MRDDTLQGDKGIDVADLYRTIIEAAPMAVVMVDGSGAIVLLNGEAERVFAYRREDLLGKRVETLLPERDRVTHEGERREFLRKPEGRMMGVGRDLFARRGDGSEIPVEVGLRPIETEAGLFVLATVVDISERKALEQERRRASQELERINEDLENFVFVASHDLRSPLRAIDNLTEWVLEDAGASLDGESKERLESIRHRIERMNSLLDGLLLFSRAGLQRGQTTRVDVGGLVRRAVEMLDVPPGFVIEIEGEFPEIETLESPLECCFRNLVMNAIQHHDRDEGRVSLRCEDRGERFLFTVEDDGPGIDPEFAERIFKALQTVGPRSNSETGGMGLAIIRRIVNTYGGSVRVAQESGRGARFLLEWPRRITLGETP